MDQVNRYSFFLFSLLLVTGGVVYGLLVDPAQGVMITLGVVAAVLIFWVLARRGARTPANPEKRIRRARGSGRPIAVYFYSDGALGCLLSRPFTARAERDYRSQCDFIYVEVSHHEADEALQACEARLGQWVLFDGTGRPAGKFGRITPALLDRVLEKAT